MDAIRFEQAPPSEVSVTALLAKGGRKLRDAIVDLCERRAWRGQFENWALHGEIDAALEAFGLERSQVPLFIRGMPEAGRLLPAMMERTGAAGRIDPVAVPQQELLRACALCPSHARCRRWLNSGATTGFEKFCRNAEVFAEAAQAPSAASSVAAAG